MKVTPKARAITDAIAAHRTAQRQAEKELRSMRLSTSDRAHLQRAVQTHEDRIRALRKDLRQEVPVGPRIVKGRIVR